MNSFRRLTAAPAVIFVVTVFTLCCSVMQPAGAARAPSEGFADLAERLLPSVVNISSTQIIDRKKSDEDMDQDEPLEEWFKNYFENRRDDEDGLKPRKRRQTSLGSGFIIDKAGYIVTNNHVIENADKITVILSDDTVLDAQLVGRDPKVDVALLKVNSKEELKPLPWGNSDQARVGDWVLAIGNPFGLGGSVSAGIVSARARDINAGQYDDFLQTDAAINRGNSGGPLLNLEGQVIGINTAIYSVTGGSAGVGFAASANLVRPVVEDLRKYGHARRGWLGVKIQTVTPEIAESLGLDRAKGALVSQVDPESPAGKAGIEARDIVLAYDGKPIDKMRELPRFVAATAVDKTVSLAVWRQGKQISYNVRIGELKEEQPPAQVSSREDDTPVERTELRDLGLSVAGITDHTRDKYELPDDVKGVVVLDVDEDGDAAEQGLRRGDVIDEIQQVAVTTADDAKAALQAARKAGRKSVLLRVVSGDDVRFVAVKLPG